MTYRSDTDTIEAGIERDRSSLASTIGELQERVSVEHLAQEALGLVKSNAAAYTRSIDSAIRANPMALALTAVGIAWLVFGGKKTDDARTPKSIDRWDDERRRALPQPGTDPAMVHPLPDPDRAGDSDWSDDVDTMRDRASSKLRAVEEDARRHASAIGEGISEGLGKARDFAAERGSVLSDFAEDMKVGFRKGLDDLSEAGRERIVAAREQAYAARIRAGSLARGGTREASRLIEDHPLVAGVVALAAGAAFAAALPRTRVEDRAFGAESDRLMHETNRLLRQERARIGRAASGVAEELKDSARDAAMAVSDEVKEASRTAASAVSQKVADTTEAIKDCAAKEAGSAPSSKARATAGGQGSKYTTG